MNYMDYFEILVDGIHTTVMATVNEENIPLTMAVDLMDYDETGLYFITATGKSFYTRLKNNPNISFTSIKGDNTLSSVAISMHGKVVEIGKDKVEDLIEKNPYMREIYSTKKSHKVLTAFKIIEGRGDFISLKNGAMQRDHFSFNIEEGKELQYQISNACGGCGHCTRACPQTCITEDTIPYIIEQEKCLRCGSCAMACPNKGILQEYVNIAEQ